MQSKKTIQETAYAKINLGLAILGRRDDGYHEVSMVMQSVALCDEVLVSAGSGDGASTCIEIVTDVPGLSCGSDNLAYKAAALLAKYAGKIPNVRIELRKKIFLAAGLAGGSADAAATLRALNRFWRLQLTLAELKALAAQLGSDVPFCIEGGTALAKGRGEIIEQLPDLPQAAVVLAKPRNLEVSTAWVYKNYNPGRVINNPKIWRLIDMLPMGARACVPYMGNVLETVTIPAHPVIAQIKAAMLGAGAYCAMMSGSGPTVFALAENRETAGKIVAALNDFDVETSVTVTAGRRVL